MSEEQDKIASQQTQALQAAKMPLEMGQRGLQLSNLDDAWRFCTAMAASGMMPKGMQTAQQILYALELGFEVGLPPLAAVQSIAVINGRASLYGDVMLGLVLASGKFDDEAFEEDWIRDDKQAVIGAYCIVRRLPKGKPRRWDFTIEDAKTANLWGKEGPWRTAPKRMLQMRARAFALRDIFPDVLKGILSREEASDIPPEKNVTDKSTVARPTNLSELTDQLIADTPIESVTSQGTASENKDAEVTMETKPETAAETVAPAAKEKATKKAKTAETVAAETTAKPAETKPTETVAPVVAAPPPKPKTEPAPVAETQAPAAQDSDISLPKGSKKFRTFVWLKEELNATDETRHTAAELAETMVEVKRTGITLEKWVKARLECAVSDITSAGMQKITAMLKAV